MCVRCEGVYKVRIVCVGRGIVCMGGGIVCESMHISVHVHVYSICMKYTESM